MNRLVATEEMPQLLGVVDMLRLDASRRSDGRHKSTFGQFLTPEPIARFMASMLHVDHDEVRLLDPGAGIGTLTAAAVADLCHRSAPPAKIAVTLYELDARLRPYLDDVVDLCQRESQKAGVTFSADIRETDFIRDAVHLAGGRLFAESDRFNAAILNPPYRKLNTDSSHRRLLDSIGVKTSNLYSAFLALTLKLLEPGGEMVAITPRSFCNGAYFRPFRRFLLSHAFFQRVHVFESRSLAFHDDDVLQENIIFRLVRATKRSPQTVDISSNAGPTDPVVALHRVPYMSLVRPDDPESFIHVPGDSASEELASISDAFPCSLSDIGLSVSTGRVVDFRAKEYLRDEPDADSVPLIYPAHFGGGYIEWPNGQTRKPNAIVAADATDALLVPSDVYVLVKRFSAKEERRRVVAAIFDPARVDCDRVGFENHLNYFHKDGRGLSADLARGLAAYLNSTLFDTAFRRFSGHTQVNATDLRNMRYPTDELLHRLGRAMPRHAFPDQESLDHLVARELLDADADLAVQPAQVMASIEEALEVLNALGLPRAQLNERSALTLLALLDLKPDSPWKSASDPLRGITPMMDFFAEHFGKKYAPNTRETVRRFTVHQFLDAGILVANPDHPERPVNSPKAVYRIEPSVLKLLRTFGQRSWKKNLGTYLKSAETLRKRYAREREMARIPIQVRPDLQITLSPGGQNILVKEIVDEFAPRFTPGGTLLYVGDADEKFAYFDEQALAKLGVVTDSHGKMPDVIIHHTERNWLVLVEAVTSHGPVNPKRREELKRLFKGSRAGLVFVTAFLDRKAMMNYLDDISWETEVWVADAPSHLIHFNGERFLGPYET